MDYQKLYDELILKARSENRVKVKGGTYYEAHHIIPKCLGGEGTVQQWRTHPNIILLTAKEHFLAHYYLTEIHPDSHKLTYAFWAMCSFLTKRSYYELEEFAVLYEDARTKLTEAGRSEDIRAKISASKKGRLSPNKGKPAHNRGKRLSEETKSKMSTSRKGKPKSEEWKAKMSAASIGRKHPPETIAKISAARKGTKLSQEIRDKISASGKGKLRSDEARANMREAWKLRKKNKSLNKS